MVWHPSHASGIQSAVMPAHSKDIRLLGQAGESRCYLRACLKQKIRIRNQELSTRYYELSPLKSMIQSGAGGGGGVVGGVCLIEVFIFDIVPGGFGEDFQQGEVDGFAQGTIQGHGEGDFGLDIFDRDQVDLGLPVVAFE